MHMHSQALMKRVRNILQETHTKGCIVTLSYLLDQVLQGIDKCVCKQDDILMGGNDWKENFKILFEVLDYINTTYI